MMNRSSGFRQGRGGFTAADDDVVTERGERIYQRPSTADGYRRPRNEFYDGSGFGGSTVASNWSVGNAWDDRYDSFHRGGGFNGDTSSFESFRGERRRNASSRGSGHRRYNGYGNSENFRRGDNYGIPGNFDSHPENFRAGNSQRFDNHPENLRAGNFQRFDNHPENLRAGNFQRFDNHPENLNFRHFDNNNGNPENFNNYGNPENHQASFRGFKSNYGNPARFGGHSRPSSREESGSSNTGQVERRIIHGGNARGGRPFSRDWNHRHKEVQEQTDSFNGGRHFRRWSNHPGNLNDMKEDVIEQTTLSTVKNGHSPETKSEELSPQNTNNKVSTASDSDNGSLESSANQGKEWNRKMTRDFHLMLYRQAVLTRENDGDGWPHIVGNCPDMCPAEEREKRSRLRDLAVFERVDSNQNKTTKELAVKKFCRTFSGKYVKQSDVRPLPVLCRTMLHLLQILDVDDYPFEVIHDFLFDRTRAIRQELTMQRIANKLAVSVYENIVRFHIMSERELRQVRTSGKVFDSHLNYEQLSKALLSLLNLYLVLGDNNTSFENEAEFYSYYVLLNLSQSQQLTLWFQSVSPALLKSPSVQFSRNVLRSYRQDNFRAFFQLAYKATYLQACLIEFYFNEVRASAIKMINYGSYKLHPFPLSELADLLLMAPDDLEEFCTVHGVSVSAEAQLLAKQSEFTSPKQPARHYHCQVIEDKRPAKFQELCSDLNILFQ